jgi:NADPH:quinone reductase
MGSKVMSTAPPPMNQGDDIAGIISEVGSDVTEYKSGDRVGAFHRMLTPGGSYAEYAVAPATTTFHLPKNISFEEAATLPLSGMTACLALYQHLKLPLPWDPVISPKKIPVLIYGGASAVGAYALQFAKLSGLSPIITVAGNGQDFVRSLNVADHIIDYRHEDVPARIKETLQGKPLRHAFDAISHHGTWEHILKAMDPDPTGCHLNMVDPPNPLPKWPAGLTFTRTYVASAYGEPHKFRSSDEAKQDRDFAYLFFRYDSSSLFHSIAIRQC